MPETTSCLLKFSPKLYLFAMRQTIGNWHHKTSNSEHGREPDIPPRTLGVEDFSIAIIQWVISKVSMDRNSTRAGRGIGNLWKCENAFIYWRADCMPLPLQLSRLYPAMTRNFEMALLSHMPVFWRVLRNPAWPSHLRQHSRENILNGALDCDQQSDWKLVCMIERWMETPISFSALNEIWRWCLAGAVIGFLYLDWIQFKNNEITVISKDIFEILRHWPVFSERAVRIRHEMRISWILFFERPSSQSK
jgi:hypothetical protein